MNPEQLRELAKKLDHIAEEATFAESWRPAGDAAAYLREQADALERGAVAWDIGADRYQVVQTGFWWRVKIGDGTALYGKYHTRAAAEESAALLLRELRNGAFLAAHAPAPQSVPEGHWLAPMEPTQEMADRQEQGAIGYVTASTIAGLRASQANDCHDSHVMIWPFPEPPLITHPVYLHPAPQSVPEVWPTDEMVVRGAEYLHDAGIRFGRDDVGGEEQFDLAHGVFRAMCRAASPAAPEGTVSDPDTVELLDIAEFFERRSNTANATFLRTWARHYVELRTAAWGFFSWANRTWTHPGGNEDHPWNRLGALLGNSPGIPDSAAPAAPAPADVVEALRIADEWIGRSPHGDNCFMSDHYDGDPGNRCNCGKDSLLDFLGAALAAADKEKQG